MRTRLVRSVACDSCDLKSLVWHRRPNTRLKLPSHKLNHYHSNPNRPHRSQSVITMTTSAAVGHISRRRICTRHTWRDRMWQTWQQLTRLKRGHMNICWAHMCSSVDHTSWLSPPSPNLCCCCDLMSAKAWLLCVTCVLDSSLNNIGLGSGPNLPMHLPTRALAKRSGYKTWAPRQR